MSDARRGNKAKQKTRILWVNPLAILKGTRASVEENKQTVSSQTRQMKERLEESGGVAGVRSRLEDDVPSWAPGSTSDRCTRRLLLFFSPLQQLTLNHHNTLFTTLHDLPQWLTLTTTPSPQRSVSYSSRSPSVLCFVLCGAVDRSRSDSFPSFAFY